MSSGEFSEKPLPVERRCPQCGALVESGDVESCWVCHGMLAAPDIRKSPAELREDRTAVWSVLALVIVCTALAFALLFEAPGALVIVLIVLTPVLIHKAFRRRKLPERRKRERESERGTIDHAAAARYSSDFIAILAVCGLVFLALMAAVVAICTPNVFRDPPPPKD